jgi:hypothetical protein
MKRAAPSLTFCRIWPTLAAMNPTGYRRARAFASGLVAFALLAIAQPRIAGQSKAIPKTPDGHPDFQGIWINGTTTPFERPANLGDKEFYTEEEVAASERQAAERRATPAPRRAGDVGTDNEAFLDTGYTITSTRQTSLVIEPPDGRMPILPEAEKRRDFNLKNVDTFETMSPWDRCITRGPTALFPANYNNGYQIIQSPGYVTIVAEMIHDARVVPVDTPHLPASVRSLSGDARGHWDGSTFVVDTTNFDDRGWISTHQGSGRLRGIPITKTLHLVERFSLADANTMIYQMTLDDPAMFARPWTVQIPFARDDHYQMFEYACAEGNQAIGNILRGARREERDSQK